MASIRWLGSAPKVAQVNTFAFAGTWEADDIIRTAFGSRTYDFTAGSTTVSTILSNLVSAWNALSASEYPEWAEITASADSSTLTLTADTKGLPFTCTITPLEAGGGAADAQTIEGAGTATTGTVATACTSPNHWSVAANWSGGAVPVDADDVEISNSAVDILYGLEQSAIELTTLTIDSTFTGKIGLPKWNTARGYAEYRTDYLEIGPVTCTIGKGSGQGSGRIKLNLTTDPCTLNVFGTGTPAETGLHALLVKGSNASNILNVFKGSVDVAPFLGETAQFPVIRVGYVSNVEGDATVRCSSGVTIAGTITQEGGNLTITTATTTVNKTAGTFTIYGAGTITTLNEFGGTTYHKGTATITTANIRGTVNCETALLSRTFTNTNIYPGGSLLDDGKTVTFSNAFALAGGAGVPDVTLRLGKNLSLQRS